MYIKEFNVKKKFKINIFALIVLFIVVLVITLLCLYNHNEWFRNKFDDIFLTNKSIGVKVSVIDISQESINSIISHDKYISTLSQGKLNGYSNAENSEYTNDISITDCISASSGKYLALGQKNGNKLYLLHGKDIIFNLETEGNIVGLSVNKNGYVAVNILKSGYRSVVVLYNPQGQILFSTYLASTYVSNMQISNNNKKLVLVEIDTSGIKVVSRIKLVDISNVSTDNTIKQLIELNDTVISKIVFSNNTDIMYLTQNNVSKLNIDGTNEVIYEFNSNDITNVDISLGNYIIVVKKENSGIFNTKTSVEIIDKNGKNSGNYKIEGTVKTLVANDNVICVGIGQEIDFITATGRLIKKYKTTMDIKDVLIYNNGNTAGLIYRNKIEIINI